ncbi:putative ribonuclease P/MRP protein subunit Pop1 [Helianthus anomalus]
MSGDGTKRLRTHIWHAKRFTMIKHWWFHLPLGKVDEDFALEVMGSKASELLQKILHPVSSMSEKYSFLKKCSLTGAVEEHTPCSEIIPLIVDDPRALTRVILICGMLKKGCTIQWTIVLPLSWVKAFWVPLVSLGARAIGLRDRSWVACEVSYMLKLSPLALVSTFNFLFFFKSAPFLHLQAGIPNFPSEFPEYSSLMEAEAAAMDKEAALRPASVKTSSIPVPPPWNCDYKDERLFLYSESMGGAVSLVIHGKDPTFQHGAILAAPMCTVTLQH